MMALNLSTLGLLISGCLLVGAQPNSQVQNTNCLKSSNDAHTCDRGCHRGFYGPYCDKNCSVHCNASCSQNTGKCLTGCEVNWFRSNCTRKCFGYCMKDVCDMRTGDCIYGCEKGYYGSTCKKTCSENCTGGLCDGVGGCSCKKGVQDTACYLECSENCLDGLCSLNTYGRLTCSKGCIAGKTGPYCQEWCPEDCFSCNRDGICTEKRDDRRRKRDFRNCLKHVGNKCDCCMDGWMDDPNCDIECPACKYNYRNETCHFSCKDGFFGETCTLSCPTHCHKRRCGKLSGNCNSGCVQGYYGHKCFETCNIKCNNSLCFQNNGSCISCEPNKYGPQCQNKCGHCQNNTCNKNGTCTCQEGWYGPKCSHECKKQCKSNICTIDYRGNHVCVGACRDGYTGDDCLSQCPEGCETCYRKNGTCSQQQSKNNRTTFQEQSGTKTIVNVDVASIVAGVTIPAAVVAIIIAVVLWMKKKHKNTKPTQPGNDQMVKEPVFGQVDSAPASDRLPQQQPTKADTGDESSNADQTRVQLLDEEGSQPRTGTIITAGGAVFKKL